MLVAPDQAGNVSGEDPDVRLNGKHKQEVAECGTNVSTVKDDADWFKAPALRGNVSMCDNHRSHIYDIRV